MKKKFKHMFDVVQALINPVALIIIAYFFIGQNWVKAEDVQIVWAVIIIQVIANLVSIFGAAYYVER